MKEIATAITLTETTATSLAKQMSYTDNYRNHHQEHESGAATATTAVTAAATKVAAAQEHSSNKEHPKTIHWPTDQPTTN